VSIDFVLSTKELGLIMLSGLKLAHHSSVWISRVFTEDPSWSQALPSLASQ